MNQKELILRKTKHKPTTQPSLTIVRKNRLFTGGGSKKWIKNLFFD